jgi:DNA-binding transcriptional LysR family regulator
MEAIRHFRAEYPEVSITLSDPLRPFQFEQLQKGEFDVAVMRGPVDLRQGLCGERLRSDPLVVALPEGHRLARKSVVDVADLAQEPFVEIALHRGYGTKELVRGVCAAAGLLPNVVQEVETVDMLVMCVAAGVGIALIYDAGRELPMPGIVYRPLRPNQETIALYAVWRAGDKNTAIAPFVRNLKDAAESLDDPQHDVPPAAASNG